MAYKVKLTKLAEMDAYSAYEYIQEVAPESADKWIMGLFSAIMTLNEMPTRCPVIPEANELEYRAHQLLYGKKGSTYRIIFDIQEASEEGKRVRILRIWHGSLDKISSGDIENKFLH